MGIRAMIALATEYYTKNIEANRAARDADHARMRLYKAMVDAGRELIPFKLGALALEALRDRPKRQKVDVRKYRELVGENVFWQTVKVSQKDVERVAGKNVLAQCLVDDDECPENVYVRPRSPLGL